MRQRLLIQQKITAMVNRYSIFEPAESPEEKPRLIGLAQQKRAALKEKVMFYSDGKRDTLAFTLRAEKVMDIHGKFFVETANGKLIGAFRKEFKASLFSSTWTILGADDTPLYTVRESNAFVAAFRRFAGAIPLVGEIMELVFAFIRYHFEFIEISTSKNRGMYKKTTIFRDHYSLETDDKLWEDIDWRVLAAVSIALDALQSR